MPGEPTFIQETTKDQNFETLTIIVGVFNTPLSYMDRSLKQKLNIETNRGYEPNRLTDINGTFHPKTKKNSFFSAPHGTFSKIDDLIGHKTTLH